MVMKSRESILQTLKHKEPDRVPRDLGGTESSGMTAYALSCLDEYLKVNAEMKIFEPYQYVAYIDETLKSRFKIDTENLTFGPKKWIRKTNPMGFEVMLPEKWREEQDEDGATIIRGENGSITARRPRDGYYFDPVNPPLQDIRGHNEIEKFKEVIFAFDLPSFADETVADLQQRACEMHAKDGFIVFNLCCHILAAGQMLRGYENFMMDLLADELMVKTLMDFLIEGYCQRIDKLAPLLKDNIDIVLLNDDLGTQNGPVFSPLTYREMIKPYQKKLFDYVRKSFGKPILFHSCGSVREFIPDLIEIGVDALNPVQISAEGMELKQLKKDFGNDITFWGGGIDTQSVLNQKTVAEIKDSVKRNVDIMAPGGGFVFCQVHNIQPDVPPENVLAMFEALDEYGSY